MARIRAFRMSGAGERAEEEEEEEEEEESGGGGCSLSVASGIG